MRSVVTLFIVFALTLLGFRPDFAHAEGVFSHEHGSLMTIMDSAVSSGHGLAHAPGHADSGHADSVHASGHAVPSMDHDCCPGTLGCQMICGALLVYVAVGAEPVALSAPTGHGTFRVVTPLVQSSNYPPFRPPRHLNRA